MKTFLKFLAQNQTFFEKLRFKLRLVLFTFRLFRQKIVKSVVKSPFLAQKINFVKGFKCNFKTFCTLKFAWIFDFVAFKKSNLSIWSILSCLTYEKPSFFKIWQLFLFVFVLKSHAFRQSARPHSINKSPFSRVLHKKWIF